MVIIVMRYKNICIYSVQSGGRLIVRLQEKKAFHRCTHFSTLFLYPFTVYFASDCLHETPVTLRLHNGHPNNA